MTDAAPPPHATPYPIRTLGDDDWPALLEVDSNAFGGSFEQEVLDAERELIEMDRAIGAYDGQTLVGVAAAFTFDLAVPGAVVPVAGVSWVGVLPTHRRRGILRALMTTQLHDIRERGREAVAVLWASEPVIYGRFGYGLASHAVRLRVPRGPDTLRPDLPVDPDLRLRLVPAEDWKLTADVYAAAAASRPGLIARDDRWYRRAVSDFPSMRQGRSALRCVVAEDRDGVRGYARYSTKSEWAPTGPQGTVDVREVVAADAPALAALYRYLLDIDLTRTVELWNVPVDDPLLHWLSSARAASPTLQDALYVRLVDVPTALGQRTYAAPVDVVIGLTDRLCPWNEGTWRLTGGADGARCERTTDEPDLRMSVTELGAAYLGGTELAELALAGRVQPAAGSGPVLAATSAAFATSPRPWSSFIF